MNVQQILDEINEKYQHSLTPGKVMEKLNTLQKELFRTIYKPIIVSNYDIVANNPFYPIAYSPSKVIDVLVNGEEYESLNIKGRGVEKFYWFTEDDSIAVYPTPSSDITGGLTVFHNKEPRLLTTLVDIPDFDQDFHMLLVYNICKQIAESYRDYDIASGFSVQYNNLLQNFNQGKQEPDYRQIQDTYGGCMLL